MNPFVWKDFHFVGGGVATLLVRVAFYLFLFVVCRELTELWWSNRNGWREAIGFYQVVMLFLVTWELSLMSARTLHDEVRGQTLASLVMLPTSITETLYLKFAGTLAATLPGLVCLVGISCFTEEGWKHTKEFFDRAAGWFFLAHFILVPHCAGERSLWQSVARSSRAPSGSAASSALSASARNTASSGSSPC